MQHRIIQDTVLTYNLTRQDQNDPWVQKEKGYFWKLEQLCLEISVQFSCSVVSNSLRPHESKHARPPCPSPTPRVYSNSCPSGWWCHPAISSSVVPFSSCLQSLPASGSFPMSQLFASGGQSIGVSASASVLSMNTQDWPLGWTGWISLQSKGLSRVFSNTTVQKHQFFGAQLSSQSNSHKTTGKTIALTRQTFVGKVMSLLFNMLYRLVITFLPRSKYLLISWLTSSLAVILEPKKIKSDTVSNVSPSICHEVMGPDAMVLVFWIYRWLEFLYFIFFWLSAYCNYIPENLEEYSQVEEKYPNIILFCHSSL